jgi:hypothetical protein
MRGDVDVHDVATLVGQQNQDEQHSARQRRDGEEIHRDGRREMIRQERPPRLRRPPRKPSEQTRYGAYRNIQPQHPQLAVNARCSP